MTAPERAKLRRMTPGSLWRYRGKTMALAGWPFVMKGRGRILGGTVHVKGMRDGPDLFDFVRLAVPTW